MKVAKQSPVSKSSHPQKVMSMEVASPKPCKLHELFLNSRRKGLDLTHVNPAPKVIKANKTAIHLSKFEVSKH